MLLLPDLREGWEYQELEREGDMSSNWHKDDYTLHAEVLTGEILIQQFAADGTCFNALFSLGVDIIRDSIEEMGDFEQDSFMHGFSLSNASTAKQIRPMGSRKSISSSSWNKKAGDYDEDETKKKDEVKSAVSSRGSSSSISKRDSGGESATTKELKAIRAQRVASKQMVVQQSSSTSASSSRVTSRRTVVQKEV